MEKARRVSPIGSAVSGVIRRTEKADREYRDLRARYRRAEAVARLLIQFRMRHNLSQEQLAKRIGASAPLISRLESGTHVPSLTTLSRIGEALGERLVIGYEPGTTESAPKKRTLVAV